MMRNRHASPGGDTGFRFSPRPNRAHEIEWRPWGDPAFAEARRLGRPVLLSLSAVWCHWCHVMDETSYSDSRVIEKVNRAFIPIRVDNDRNPDVNRRYNMGGWPTTAFLTAGGQIVTGATYTPPGQLLQALERVEAFFAENSATLLAADASGDASALEEQPTDSPPGQIPSQAGGGEAALAGDTVVGGDTPFGDDAFAGDTLAGDPDAPGDIPAGIALQIVRAFDPLHGGLGTDPKFPQADAFEFLLAYAGLRESDGLPKRAAPGGGAPPTAQRLGEVVDLSLEKMSAGDLYDHVAGGFFRYATKRDWSEPHYEKMLEDNARLCLLYLDAAMAASVDDRAAQGRGTGPSTAGASSIDRATQYRRVAGGVVDYLVATLWRPEVPALGGSQDADEQYYRLEATERATLPAPLVDATIYVDWNALAAQALLRAALVLGRPELAVRAQETLEFLWQHGRRGERMVHYLTTPQDPSAGAPLLADQAHIASALLDAYEATAEPKWLARAEMVAGWAGDHLRAPDGRLNDRGNEAGASAGLLSVPVPALDENALMAGVFLRLQAYAGDDLWRGLAFAVLAAWRPHHEQLGVGAAPYGLALLRYLERPDHIVVVGGRGDEEARRLYGAALASPRPLRTVQLLDPGNTADAARIAARGFAAAAAPAAYACRGHVCSPFSP